MIPEKSRAAGAAIDIELVEIGRGRAERRRGAGGAGRLLRQAQILQHVGRGEAGRIAAVRRRRRHRARHRAIAGHRPALAGRCAADVEQRLRRQPELLGQRKTLAHRDHRGGEDHVVADLGGLAGAGRAGMDDRAAHRLAGSARPRAKAASSPPTMKVRVAASAPIVPPETGASSICKPRLGRRRGDRARGLDVDRRAVDQQRARPGAGDDPVGAEIDRAHLRPGRQHRDDDIAGRRGLGDARGGVPALLGQSARSASRRCRSRSPGAAP